LSENDLCNFFISHVKELRFDVFSEYKGWDIVLHRNNVIIGVEAKLETNLHLLAQLCQKDDVNFKVALLPQVFSFSKNQSVNDWILIARRLKILPVFVDMKQSMNKYPISFYHGTRNLFYYRHRPKQLLKLPDFHYEVDAGVPSPRKVSGRNIALVKLEIFAVEQGGYVSLGQIRSFGFRQPPREYYEYDWDKKMYRILNMRRASKDFPHIMAGIRESLKR